MEPVRPEPYEPTLAVVAPTNLDAWERRLGYERSRNETNIDVTVPNTS